MMIPAPTTTESVRGQSTGSAAPLLILISAPSGAGKTTLCQQALAARPEMLRAITCTTRAPRPGERDGVDYHFMDAAAFLTRVQSGHFLEHATVYGHSYGTLRGEVLGKLRLGSDVLLNVDVQGAATIRERAAADADLRRSLVTVFLTPSSISVLESRLRKRASDSEQVIQRRLAVARQEIAQWRNFDYLLVSGTVKQDLEKLLRIIEVEKIRTARAQAPQL